MSTSFNHSINLDTAPMMFYWEVTRACDLACRHCRAEAMPLGDPRELTTNEGLRLLDAVAGFEPKPHLVFTGGDPLRRADLFELISHAVELGIVSSVTPAGTPLCTQGAIRRMRDSGVNTVAFSIDASNSSLHDAIRGVPGSFDLTVRAVRWALEAGLNVQINSVISAETAPDLPALDQLVRNLGAQRWSVFFLIQVGRGAVLNELSPEAAEEVLGWLLARSKQPGPIVKTTEAHHFRRIVAQQAAKDLPESQAASVKRGWNIRDGAGIMFVSHIGDVYPSGFLPIEVGNVRQSSPVDLYRNAPLFRQLRDPDQFKGKCGACEFRYICGGSRARAFVATSDPLGSDPLCVYEPKAVAAVSAS